MIVKLSLKRCQSQLFFGDLNDMLLLGQKDEKAQLEPEKWFCERAIFKRKVIYYGVQDMHCMIELA